MSFFQQRPGEGRGGRIVWMVWLLVAVGLVGGSVAMTMAGLSLWKARTERQWLLTQAERLKRTSEQVFDAAFGAREEFNHLFDPETEYIARSEWIDDALRDIAAYKAALDVVQANSGVTLTLDSLDRAFRELEELLAQCRRWRAGLDSVYGDLRAHHTLGEVRDILRRLREKVEIAEGDWQIRQAGIVLRHRAATGAEAQRLSDLALSPEARRTSRLFATVSVEIAELGRLSEQLAAAQQPDWLLDLRENAFRPSLDRLKASTALLGRIPGIESPIGKDDLRTLDQALFGPEAASGEESRLAVEGGLYGLAQQYLSLKQRGRALAEEAQMALAFIDSANIELGHTTRNFADAVATRVEETLSQSWRNIIVLAAASVLAFFALGWAISRGVGRQVAELDRSERRFRRVMEGAPDAMVLVDTEGRLALVNNQTEALFGYARSELLGRPLETLIPERFAERHKQQVREFFKSPKPRSMGTGLDILGRRKDGSEFPADISLSPLDTEQGLFVLADIRDITQRKQAEEQIKRGLSYQSAVSRVLRVSLEPLGFEEQLARILGHVLELPELSGGAKGCLYLLDVDSGLLAMRAQKGLEPKLVEECSLVSLDATLCSSPAANGLKLLTSCARDAAAGEGVAMDGSGHCCVPIRSSGKLLGVISVILEASGNTPDTTREQQRFLLSVADALAGVVERHRAEIEKEKLQHKFLQSEKLAALGRLTDSVAHEIRNPLMAIGGFAKRLEALTPEEGRMREYVQVIRSEAIRLDKILRGVVSFTRESGPPKPGIQLSGLMDAVLAEQGDELARAAITVGAHYGNEPPVHADPERLLEAIRQLTLNAMDAMPDGGTLAVQTGAANLDGTTHAFLEISDTGPGIPQEMLGNLFEPFFTTRNVGQDQGVGLGLAISKKIVDEHAGFLTVDSEPGRGTRLRMLLPS